MVNHTVPPASLGPRKGIAGNGILALEAGSGRHLPIIAMTAHAMAEDRDRCLAAGMDDYLTKPVRREILLQAVARWCPVSWVPAPD